MGSRPADSEAPTTVGGDTTEAEENVQRLAWAVSKELIPCDDNCGTCLDCKEYVKALSALSLLAAAARRTEQAETERDEARRELDASHVSNGRLIQKMGVDLVLENVGLEQALRRIRDLCREGHGDDLIAVTADAALVSGAAEGNSDE